MKVWQLRQMQGLPLEMKIQKSFLRIREFYERMDGQVYISFSGGKDSTVLLHLVHQLYPDVPPVFVLTKTQYPEVVKFARSIEGIVIRRPDKSVDEVLSEDGYPVVSKKVSKMIRTIRNPSPKNARSRVLYSTGKTTDGRELRSYKLPNKWTFLLDAPFKISEKCCYWLKHKAFEHYNKETGRKPYIGTLADESDTREKSYLKTGCNSFDHMIGSRPLGFWAEQDILEYLVKYNVPYSDIYGEINQDKEGQYYCTGERRTGCIYCPLGVDFDESPNRFQRLAVTHPKQYNYAINRLGMGQVLDYLGVPYEPTI